MIDSHVLTLARSRTTAYRQLRATTTELAEGYEDPPVVKPHMTVIGGIDGERTALEGTKRMLAARIEPLELAFGGVRWATI